MGYVDGQVVLEGMMMNYNASGFYEKWVTDYWCAIWAKAASKSISTTRCL